VHAVAAVPVVRTSLVKSTAIPVSELSDRWTERWYLARRKWGCD